MNFTGLTVLRLFACLFLFWEPLARGQMTDVLTYHNDNARTGQTLHEEVLTPGNVNMNHFGLLRTLAVDGMVTAEPLYAAGVMIPDVGERNLLIVATQSDSVYAFDADGSNVYWQVTLLGEGEGNSGLLDNCDAGMGVFETPVIDRQAGPSGTVFVEAMSQNGYVYFQRMHALDLASGAELATPTATSATFPGTGDNASDGYVVFDPQQYREHCSLLAQGGVIYTAWSSHCDTRPYTGWVIGFDEATLAETNTFNITANGNGGAIWDAGGLAGDGAGNVYALAGNGTFDATLSHGFPTNGDYGNAIIKFTKTDGALTVGDYFTMSNTVQESEDDVDFGSGGALLLPDMTDASNNVKQLAVGAGKDSIIYIVNRNDMGRFRPETNAIWQQVDGAVSGGLWSIAAYWNGMLYFGGVGDFVKSFPFQNARLQAQSSETAEAYGYPGAAPSISANGRTVGILWAIENTTPMILHAYNATNLASELYNSAQAGSRDQSGAGYKFITPMIASARVYVGEPAGVAVFGLLDDSTLTPLQAWRDTNFGNPSAVGAGADGASPAGDGIPNLVKYALGLNPLTVAATNQLPIGSLQTNGGVEYLTLTVNRAAVAPDVSYVVEVSGDLTNWFSDSTYTVTLTNSSTQLVVRDNVPVGEAGERYIRLAVTSP